jgi:hypothetical protein
MVPDVTLGLAEHRGNLIQRIAFDEVQPESLLLILGQDTEQSNSARIESTGSSECPHPASATSNDCSSSSTCV